MNHSVQKKIWFDSTAINFHPHNFCGSALNSVNSILFVAMPR